MGTNGGSGGGTGGTGTGPGGGGITSVGNEHLTGSCNGNGATAAIVKTKPLILKDVFVTPSFDELDAVAVDLKGDPRRLSSQHLHSIREKG